MIFRVMASFSALKNLALVGGMAVGVSLPAEAIVEPQPQKTYQLTGLVVSTTKSGRLFSINPLSRSQFDFIPTNPKALKKALGDKIAKIVDVRLKVITVLNSRRGTAKILAIHPSKKKQTPMYYSDLTIASP